MSVLKIKNTAGEWIDIPAIKGANGKDGKEYDDTEIKAEITALKGYVDDKCENSSLNTFVVPYNINFTITYNNYKLTITNEDLISKIQEIVNTAYTKEMQKINLQILINGSPTLLKCDYYHSSSTDTQNAGRYITEKPSELRYFSTDIPYQIGNSAGSYSTTYAGYSSLSLVLYVYLSWEDDVATVTSLFMRSYAPRGRFVGEDFMADYYLSRYNSKAYTPTTDYHPATKKYVDDNRFKEKPSLEKWLNNGFEYEKVIKEEPFEYTLENISAYGFELNDNGFYESTCKGINSGYSLCKITFNVDGTSYLNISYISSGEKSNDYGIFGNLDQILTNSNTSDGNTGTTKVKLNCKDAASLDVKNVEYVVPAGEHFIYIKYRKDGSVNKDNDSLQFKMPENVIVYSTVTERLITKEDVTNISGNLEELETEDKTNLVGAINEVKNSGGGDSPIYIVELEDGFTITNADKQKIADAINAYHDKYYPNNANINGKSFCMLLKKKGYMKTDGNFNFACLLKQLPGQTSTIGTVYLSGIGEGPNVDFNNKTLSFYLFTVECTWSNKKINITDFRYTKNDLIMTTPSSNRFQLTNANFGSTIDPSNANDYARKSYVDNAIANAITTTLGGEY